MSDVNIQFVTNAAAAKPSVDAFNKALDDTGVAGQGAETKLGGLWKSVFAGQLAFEAAHFAGRQLKQLFTDSIGEAAGYEKGVATLNATFAASGRTMPGMTNNLRAYADELQDVGLADDAAILNSETLLLRMTNLNEKGIKEGARLAAGLSQVYGMDLNTSTEIVGKGLMGVYRGFTTLSPSVVNATTDGDKHAAMMKFLNDTYVAAITQTKVFTGETKSLGLEWNERKKQFGEAILQTGILQKSLQIASDVLKGDVGRHGTSIFIGVPADIRACILAIDPFLTSLETLKIKFKDAEGIALMGAAAWKDYSEGTKRTDEYLTKNKDTIIAWMRAGLESIGLLDKSKTGFTETGRAVGDTTGNIKTLKEQLNLTFNADLEAKIAMIQQALKLYKGQLTHDEEDRLKKSVSDMSDQMATGGLVADGMAQRFKNLQKPLQAIATVIESDIDPAFKDMWPPIDFITNAMNKRAELLKASFYAFFNIIPPASKQAETALETFAAKVDKILQGKIIPMYTIFYSQLTAISNQQQQNENINLDNEYKKRREVIDKSTADEKTKAAQILALDSEFAQKRREVSNKATQAQKAMAIAQATISMIEAEAKALTAAPPPWNFVLMALVAAASGVLIAKIAAQPIPLAKGAVFNSRTQLTSNSGQTYDVAEAGEAEILSSPSRLREAIYGKPRADISGGSSRPIHVHVHNEIGGKLLNDQVIEIVQDASDTNRIKIKARAVN